MRLLIHSAGPNLKQVFLSSPLFIQFLYSLRHIWWGAAACFFGLSWSLSYLKYLTDVKLSFIIFLIGIIGMIGLLRGTYIFSFIFSLLNVFVFASISLTFFKYDAHSAAGVNYLIEMFVGMWLVFRIQYDRAKIQRYQIFRG